MNRQTTQGKKLLAAKFFCSIGGLLLCGNDFAAPQAHANAAPPSVAVGERTGVEVITIERGGASPSQITRGAGKFLLVIRNRVAGPSLPLIPELRDVLGNVVPNVVDSASLLKRRLSLSPVDLPPGDYYLRAPQSARLLCEIHIR